MESSSMVAHGNVYESNTAQECVCYIDDAMVLILGAAHAEFWRRF